MSSLAITTSMLNQHLGILGKTGSGKSNLAKVLVERLLADGARVCVLDPTGTWWGLRLRADGKPSRFPVVIFGGMRADLPIGSNHGAAIAETVGTSTTPAIIDTRLMTVGERTKFFADFAETLLAKNSGPLHLVIDEAHVFAPQGRVADPASGRMLHAANNLVSLGRGIGLRIILISQRPAKIHKDSLTQIETLVAMRLIAPQDRRAVEDWIGEWADPATGRDLLTSLASLKTGEGWVWSPGLDVLARQQFPLAVTFDSGKPQDGGGPQLQAIDIDAVATKLETVASDALNNDPKRLRAEIARLTKELAAKQPAPAPDPKAIEDAERRGFNAGVEATRQAFIPKGRALSEALDALLLTEVPFKQPVATKAPPSAPPPAPRQAPAPVPGSVSDGTLKPALQRVIDAIGWWRRIGKEPVERARASVVAGYSPRASTFGVYLAELVKLGLVDTSVPGKVSLTVAGLAAANIPEAVGRDDLRRMAVALLSPAEAKVFDVIYAAWPNEIRRRSVAEEVGLSPTASTAGVYIAAVAAYGIIEAGTPGHVRAADWLFP